MSRNGSGTYSLPAGNPVVSGTSISSTVQNNTMSDIATALTNSIAKDGQTTPTANLPMGTYKHTGVAAGSNLTDYARLDQTQNATPQWLTSVAGVDTITASASPVPSAYASGQTFRFTAAGANTGAVTLNISSLGAKAITKKGTTALTAGDLPNASVITVVYDGTQFQLTNIGNLAASGANSDITSLGNLTSVGTVTTIDINGGTMDGASVGGTTPAAGAFTTLSASGASTLSGNVGVGTAPSFRLHVANSAATSTTLLANVLARLQANASGADCSLQFSDNVANSAAISLNGGNIIFSLAGSEKCRVNVSDGGLLVTAQSGIGYGTGAGGSVTQLTSKSTGVTLNTPCGQVTMHAAALAANTSVSFTMTNSKVAATDAFSWSQAGGTNGAYTLTFTPVAPGGGSVVVTLRNVTAGSLSEAFAFNFAVNKLVTS